MARRYARSAGLDQLLTGTPSFAALLEQLEAHPEEPSERFFLKAPR